MFDRINTANLFNRVFFDYWNVYLTLINAIISNGKRIWMSDDNAIRQAENISKNLSNPNFPQDKATEVIIQILLTCPYKKDYQKLLKTKFGNIEDVQAINEYFGYKNLDDISITG